MVAELNENNFLEKVIESDIPVLVDFSANWCIPCKPMSDIIDKLSREYEGRVKFYKLDVDKNTDLADKLNIKSVPSLLLFRKDGGKVDAQVGLTSEKKIKSKIEEML